MKNKKMKQLILLGISAGIFMAEQQGLEAVDSNGSIDLNYVLAKPSCKAHGGCGGLTANRDVNNEVPNYDDENDEQDDLEEVDLKRRPADKQA